MTRLFNGVSFLLIITIVAYFGGVWFITPTIAILPFSVSLYRKLNDWSIAAWFHLVPVGAYFVLVLKQSTIFVVYLYMNGNRLCWVSASYIQFS